MRTRNPRVPFLALALAAGCAAPHADAPVPPDGTWIDLTHDFAADTLYWPTSPPFRLEVASAGETEAGYWYAANTFAAAEHGGTHVDAPVHFARQGSSVDRVPLARLIGAAVVVDVSSRVSEDRDYEVRVDDLAAFERAHGRIPDGAIVLLRTGHGRTWPDAAQYLGTAERGPEAALKLHFPGLHPSAAQWLVEQRAVAAVGIDTASIDHGPSRLFLAHRELSAHDVPVFENVANLERLPPVGAWVVALPMKIRGGSGAPLRIVARVP